jgi:hypothetical protein
MRARRPTLLGKLAAAMIVFVAAIAATSIPLRSSIVAGAPDPPQPADNPWSAPLRDLLLRPCGSCHRSSLATAKPRALAVFDLEERAWHRHMTDDQIRELARRARSSNEIDEWDRPIIERFVRCRLDAECALQAPRAPAPADPGR